MEAPAKRRWSLLAAREMLAEVRRHTEEAVTEVEALLQERESRVGGPGEAARRDAQIRELVNRWVRAMEALGLEVKGLWLVDFDNGEGYYCWKWPETELAYFHGYDEGYGGRVRIQ